MKLRTILVAAAMLLAPALAHAGMEMKHGDLVLSGAWTRATPAKASTGAAFLTIENRGGSADRLVAIRTPISDRPEIHTMTMENGVMKMRQLKDGIEIPAGGTAILKPGGNHLMFMRLNQQIKKGTSVAVTLVFEEAGEITLDFAAAPVGSRKPPMMHNKH